MKGIFTMLYIVRFRPDANILDADVTASEGWREDGWTGREFASRRFLGSYIIQGEDMGVFSLHCNRTIIEGFARGFFAVIALAAGIYFRELVWPMLLLLPAALLILLSGRCSV